MAGFVQIIEYRTSKPEEVARLSEDFRSKSQGGDGPAPTRVTVCADRDESGRYFTIAEFASYEEAMENNNRPETNEFAERMTELCDGPAKFYNLDLEQSIEFR
ncbi:hypothetical protein [Kribbella swartbergensis]